MQGSRHMWWLSDAERARWRDDGFFVRTAVFSAREVAALQRAAERCVERARAAVDAATECYEIDGNVYHEAGGATIQLEHATGSEVIRVIEPFHHLDAEIDRVIDDPRLVDPMRELVGAERISLFTDKLNLKRPREGSRFRWHQDSPYWAHFHPDLDRLPNVLVALDAADERNGCFRVIRGSHRRGMLPGSRDGTRLGALFTAPEAFDLSAQVPIVVPEGSLVFFSPHVVHGSEPNLSDASRRALVITYQPGTRRMFQVDAKREVGALQRPGAE